MGRIILVAIGRQRLASEPVAAGVVTPGSFQPMPFFRTIGRAARFGLAAVAVAITLWAFGWVATRPLRKERAAPGQVVLRVLHWGDKEEDRIVRDLIDAFQRQHPEIKVVRTNTGSPAQLATKLQTMLASGDPPDLFYLPFEKVAAIASHDVLEDIEPYVERDRAAGAADAPDLSDFFPATLDAFRYDPITGRVGAGRLVGLPKDFTCVGFYYNKDLFARAGCAAAAEGGLDVGAVHRCGAADRETE